MKQSTDKQPILLWYRNDLRIADHPALCAAANQSVPVIPVFIDDDTLSQNEKRGGASKWWLHGSLSDLDRQLRSLGSRLILRRGKAARVLAQLVAETNASAVYFARSYDPSQIEDEDRIKNTLMTMGIDCHRFRGALLFEPEEIKTKTGTPFKVFTPFYRACMASNGIKDALPAPDHISEPRIWPESDPLEAWQLRPTTPDWAGGLADHWTPGSSFALNRLESFLEDSVKTYIDGRDRPQENGTSTLSPFFCFGEISPRQVWHRVDFERQEGNAQNAGSDAFLRQLVWREFSYHLLFHWPHVVDQPFNRRFADFPWARDDTFLTAWQAGKTGYPIVDAGMRQLWHTGWMHNRVRMIVASFLTKHLGIHWRDGADWFWDTLVDADRANNTAGWQWVAGCGADAAPYFRIFNPILQGGKFDPEGTYVRTWVPELADVDKKFIHSPWEAPYAIEGYPPPIVDHKQARQRALSAYAEMTSGAGDQLSEGSISQMRA